MRVLGACAFPSDEIWMQAITCSVLVLPFLQYLLSLLSSIRGKGTSTFVAIRLWRQSEKGTRWLFLGLKDASGKFC